MRKVKLALIAVALVPFGLLSYCAYDGYYESITVGGEIQAGLPGEHLYIGERYAQLSMHPLLSYWFKGSGHRPLMVSHDLVPFGITGNGQDRRIIRYPFIHFEEEYGDLETPLRRFLKCGPYIIPGSQWGEMTIDGETITDLVAEHCPVTRLSSTPPVIGTFPADVTAALERALNR